MSPVIVFTHSGDIHASHFADLALQQDREFHLVFTDRMSNAPTFSYAPSDNQYVLADIRESKFVLQSASAVWWRRISAVQQNSDVKVAYKSFVDTSWSSLFESELASILPDTRLVNDPVKSRIGYNKLTQLRHAERLGFNIPETLISNDLQMIRETFTRKDLMVKPLVTDSQHPIYVNSLDLEEAHELQVQLAPCIYQEKLDSTVNYRVNVFGDRVIPFRITNKKLDWRIGDYTIEHASLDDNLVRKCSSFVKQAGLEMGCIDLKEDKSGDIYFLENNPQGQFDFIEAKSGFPLMQHFVDYMYCQ